MTAEENIKLREVSIRELFIRNVGYEPNLENPKTFNEKIQWLKLYNHNPLITKCADKYLVKEYVKEKIGEQYVIPLLGVWDKVEDIDFNSLPNQFVLKTNYGSNQNIVVKDKSKLDIEATKKFFNYFLRPFASHYYKSYEWSYKNINPKIICEKYIKNDKTDNLIVYGIYCFDGEPHYIHTITDAHTNNDRCNIYDTKWNKQPLTYIFENTDYDIEKPKQLDLMLDLAKKLSKDFIHIRIDFYDANDTIYFSEMTFYTNNGTSPFKPVEWDYKFGDLINLPKEKKIEYDFIDRDTLLREYLNLEKISFEYKKLEEEIIIKNNDLSSKDNIIDKLNDEIYRLKEKEEEYNNLINKIAWWIPIKKWRDDFRNKISRPDQTRPDQTRPDQTMN